MNDTPTKQRILNVAKVTLVKDLQHLSTELQVSQHLIELYIKQLNSEGHNIKVVNGYVKYNPGLIEKVRDLAWK
jgi:biotin operon repressor